MSQTDLAAAKADMVPESAVSTRNISKNYGDVEALRNLSLVLRLAFRLPGQVQGLVVPVLGGQGARHRREPSPSSANTPSPTTTTWDGNFITGSASTSLAHSKMAFTPCP